MDRLTHHQRKWSPGWCQEGALTYAGALELTGDVGRGVDYPDADTRYPPVSGRLDHGGVEEGARGQNWPAEASLGSIPGSTESVTIPTHAAPRSRFTPCSYVSPSPAGYDAKPPQGGTARALWLAIGNEHIFYRVSPSAFSATPCQRPTRRSERERRTGQVKVRMPSARLE